MTVVVSVRFKDSGRTYYFDPLDFAIQVGDMVIVDTVHGPELARVVRDRFEVEESDIVGELKSVLRKAEEQDFTDSPCQKVDYEDILARCNEKVKEHNLDMRLIKAEYNFYGSRLTFYFTAEQRIDFRALVRDLARTFKTRIELRQIGPRDKAKLLGGIGCCGRMLCCSTFLPDYTRVSIKMAKDQDLPLNPSKISGVCGRLLCCLSYEHQQYVELKSGLPRRGTWVETIDGKGTVVAVNILQQIVTVQLASSGMQEQYTLSQIEETHAPSDDEVVPVNRVSLQESLDEQLERLSSLAFLNESEDPDHVFEFLDEDEVFASQSYEQKGGAKKPASSSSGVSGQKKKRGGGSGRANAPSSRQPHTAKDSPNEQGGDKSHAPRRRRKKSSGRADDSRGPRNVPSSSSQQRRGEDQRGNEGKKMPSSRPRPRRKSE